MFGGWDNQLDLGLAACTSTTMDFMDDGFAIYDSAVEMRLAMDIKYDCKSVRCLWLDIVSSLNIHVASKAYCEYTQDY